MLNTSIAADERRKYPETDAWLEDVVQAIDALKNRMPRRHQQQLPAVLTCTEETEWRRWRSECAEHKAIAKEECKQLKAEQKKIAHARKTKYQKRLLAETEAMQQANFGKSSKQSLDAVQDPVTRAVHTDPNKLRECV